MYIQRSSCISAQQTFAHMDLENLNPLVENMLRVIEPKYDGIPLNILRRMGKAVRLGVGAAMPVLKDSPKTNGIIIGTANGGMEDCIKFLNQVVQFDEGTLTPTNFVQSTPNSIAAQIGLNTRNNNYNITHVHRGLAFENSLMDATMLLDENPDNTYLVGGLDEISDYNFNIDSLGNWYKKETTNNTDLYQSTTHGSIAGEGVAMFLMSSNPQNALAKIAAIKTLHTNNTAEVAAQLKLFIEQNLEHSGEKIDLFFTGENGDSRLQHFYNSCENLIPADAGICRFKHFTGEFPTASALGLWLACNLLNSPTIPAHFIKRLPKTNTHKNLLLYNTYKGEQHSFILVSK